MSNHPLIKISIAPFSVLVLFIILILLGLFEAYWWLDIPLHFLGGAAVALWAYYLLEYFEDRKLFHNQFKPMHIFILIAFVGLAASCWELFEFTFDTYIAAAALQPGIADSMRDMAMGISGGGLMAIIAVLKPKS